MGSFSDSSSDDKEANKEQSAADALLDSQISEAETQLAEKRESLLKQRMDVIKGNKIQWNPEMNSSLPPVNPFAGQRMLGDVPSDARTRMIGGG